MDGSNESVKALAENSKESFLEAAEILLKFSSNIVNHPKEDKYRRIRLGNDIVQSKLLPAFGAIECLFDMGFLEDGEYLTLPTGSSLVNLMRISSEIGKAVEKATGVTHPKPDIPPPNIEGPTASNTHHRPTADLFASELKFYMKLKNSFEHVMMYEDRLLQEHTRTCIPVDRLQREARQELASLAQSKTEDNQPKLHEEDFVLLGLLNWFKTSFFQWVDAPNCENCGEKTVNVGMVEPLPEEIRWGGDRVENYKCSKCSTFTRFPRYNHPGKLLQSRRGRCGEWANCFTLCCRSLGMESRYVLDWTDHVWTEVYSMSQRRWLHCDPCENICDKPLLYSSGWGKKLTYVIAFSKDDIQDVTWRYTTNHAEVLRRRSECRETYLINTIFQMRRSRQAGLSEVRRKVLAERLVMELADFMTAKSADGEELPGRTTGSLAWRQQRGEVGSKPTATFDAYSFKPVLREIESKCMHVKYCCVSDIYIRVSDAESETKGWDSCVHEAGVLQRKEERDWNMVYLARNPGQNESSSITWKFDFTGTVVVAENVSIKLSGTTFENGRLTWRLCSDNECMPLTGSSVDMTCDLPGSKVVTLTAQLSGGTGDSAWQHAQLFRQEMKDEDGCPFDVKINLKHSDV